MTTGVENDQDRKRGEEFLKLVYDPLKHLTTLSTFTATAIGAFLTLLKEDLPDPLPGILLGSLACLATTVGLSLAAMTWVVSRLGSGTEAQRRLPTLLLILYWGAIVFMVVALIFGGIYVFSNVS